MRTGPALVVSQFGVIGETVLPSVPQVNGTSHAANGRANGDAHRNGAALVNANGKAEIVEFSGSSDANIADAIRKALACASRTLPTLDGAGVRVIPQLALDQSAPRFRVTLCVTAASLPPAPTTP